MAPVSDPQPAAAAFVGRRSAIATAAIIVVAACMAPAPSQQSLDAAVIRSLDGYAALLAERGRLSQAAEVSTQAEKMREGERARAKGATSYYLGFQPDRTLDQYAAELRRLGQDAPAADAARLAVQYREAQIWAVDALVKGRASP